MIEILLLLVFLVLVVISAQGVIHSLLKITRMFGISSFVEFFIIVSISSSLPQLFIGIHSSLAGQTLLGVGNTIGANIVALTFIAGLGFLFIEKTEIHKELKKDTTFMFFAILLSFILLVVDFGLSQLDGVILIAVFLIYNFLLSIII